MICKERVPSEHHELGKFSEAGAKAEQQMAFYLRRAFADDPEIRVFNDLRFEDEEDDAVQIDHLLLHPHCIIVIESKSVTAAIRVNKYNEWARIWNGQAKGMPSPILQSQRQVDRLKKILDAYTEELQISPLQKRFNDTPFHVLVGVSDSGIIQRDIDLPEVCKADQVPSRAAEAINYHKKNMLPANGGKAFFTDSEIQNITAFLLKYHYPLDPDTPSMPAIVPSPKLSVNKHVEARAAVGLGVCQKCKTQSNILWGKFGYYWKCPACQDNMPIKIYCPVCRGKLKLRKNTTRFYKYCEQCRTPEVLYYQGK